MSFNSIAFIVAYLLLLVVYWNISDWWRNPVLLIFGWAYLATWDWIYLVFLVLETIIAYTSGILIGKNKEADKRKTGIVAIPLVLLIGILAVVKYSKYAIPVVGISFFTFHAISYILDVYRDDIECEKNFTLVALYVGFFPQLLCGPITKAKEQIPRYKKKRIFDIDVIESAFFKVAYGLMLKMVLVDRIGIFIDDVYANPSSAGGVTIALAILLYSIQIYCDFAGYSFIAIGIAESLGIELVQNFQAPYLSKSMNEFWKRWHISLTSWFRDYLYIPLGGNRKGKIRTYVNILIVFLVSGVWHGAGITFLLWGLFHGVLLVVEKFFLPKRKIGIAGTYLLTSLLWVLFRADSLERVKNVFGGIIQNANGYQLSDIVAHGLTVADWICVAVIGIIMMIIDSMIYRKYDITSSLRKKPIYIRWALLYLVMLIILILGVYGPGYDTSNFIYVKF